MISLARAVAATIALGLAASAQAGLFPAYPLGAGPGVWEVDRHAPAIFSNAGTVNGRNNVLDLGVDAADHFDPAVNNFANTQGRGIQILAAPGYSVLYGSLYPQAAWGVSAGTATNRRTELWGVLAPAAGSDICPGSACNLFPIIGFSNASPVDPINAGGAGRFRVFDPYVGFVDLPATVNYGQWNDVCMAWDAPVLRFFVNGAEVYNKATVDPGPPYGPPTHWSRQIQQEYNWGTTYDSNWSGPGHGRRDGRGCGGRIGTDDAAGNGVSASGDDYRDGRLRRSAAVRAGDVHGAGVGRLRRAVGRDRDHQCRGAGYGERHGQRHAGQLFPHGQRARRGGKRHSVDQRVPGAGDGRRNSSVERAGVGCACAAGGARRIWVAQRAHRRRLSARDRPWPARRRNGCAAVQ